MTATANAVDVKFSADTDELEERIERCIALAERFREVWGASPRPDGLERVVVRPGDTIVLRYDGRLSVAELENISAQANEMFPDANVRVLAGGITLEGVLGSEPRANVE